MKLLNVEVVLDREKDIQQAESDPEVLKELDDEATHYAILSHRWGVEVTYKEMTGLTKMEEWKRDEVRKRYGYQKIIKSCQQAMKDGYKWLWIDTCCIDKRSSSELSEAINSMYRWYRNAQVCYAYLNDVHESAFPIEQNNSEHEFGNFHGWPEWFVRGWTLQELIAPKRVEFFNKDWAPIGNKRHLAPTLERITGIPLEVLRDGLTAKCLSVAQIMSWAADRQTSRLEDRAYSLMGLFGVNMPMLYGEGKKAFHRLQLEIIRISGDHSIFAWDPWKPRPGSVLAEDPSDFRDCVSIKKMEPDDFHRLLKNYIENKLELDGLRNDAETHWHKLAALRDAAHSRQFRTFTVSNAGIQVWLPVIPSSDSPSLFRATLACSHGSRLVTIDLISPGTSFDRTFGTTKILRTYPEFRTLYLSHHQNEMRCEFLLDDKNASYRGFTRCGTFPREFTGDTVALSSVTNDLIVMVCANNDTRSHFAVGIGYYLGQGWVHVINDERLASEEEDWKSPGFASRIYDRMWNARAEHARSMPKQEHDYGHCHDYFIKHTHLPQSIWCARVIWGRWETDNFKIMIDVDQCPGCCDGPRAWTITSNGWNGLDMPGLMNTVHHSYSMELDGWLTRFDKFSGHRIVLGDYGDYLNGNFKRTGNIFEDMMALGIDPMESAYCPVVSYVSSDIAYHDGHKHLALCQPRGFSLPANECFVLLLKALSTRLAGKCLVITVVKCVDIYGVGIGRKRRDNSVPDSGSYAAEPSVMTPLCAIASPQVWRREPPCAQRREQFKSIREHFYALVNMVPPQDGKKDRAIEFFCDVFGLEYLKNYIGNITFFKRLSLMVKTDSTSEVSVGSTEDGLLGCRPKFPGVNWTMTCNPFKSNQQSNAAQDLHSDVVLPLLRRRCQILCAWRDSPRRYTDEKQKVECESNSIQQTLGAGLLEGITTTFGTASYEHENLVTDQIGHKHDRQLDIPSMVQEINVLQGKVDATEDDDEKRALEEDLTGKILWLCWCGICAEANQALPKVVDFIWKEGNIRGLWEISAIMDSVEYIDRDDNQTHMQRIMRDAGAGTSKHRLLLAARAAEQAKWSQSGTARATPAIDDPSSSARAPSTSAL